MHTLGPGSIIVETQQQSDTTFRLYDYGRPRELHLERGMHVIKERAPSGKVRPQAFSNLDRNGNRLRQLVASEYFAVQAFELSSKQEFHELPGRSSAQILVAIEGAGALCTHGSEPVEFTQGDAVVVPAAIREFSVESRPRLQFLKSYVPGVPVSSPETSIE